MIGDGATLPPGSQAWVTKPVCDQEDGTKGAVDAHLTAGKGCLTAQALCCGGNDPYCMVNTDDKTQSRIKNITVPCGVNVKYSYKGRCDMNNSQTGEIAGDGVPKVLACDNTTATDCPYSFQVSLAPGYECKNGSVVVKGTNKKPCVDDPNGFPSHNNPGGSLVNLSRNDIIVALVVVGIVLILITLMFKDTKDESLLNVDQIIQRSGVNEHLVIPK